MNAFNIVVSIVGSISMGVFGALLVQQGNGLGYYFWTCIAIHWAVYALRKTAKE